MADIIQLKDRRGPVSDKAAQDRTGTMAEILLFTGVRYERLPDPDEGTAGLAGRRSHRSAKGGKGK